MVISIFLIFFISYVFSQTDLLSNETLTEVYALNELPYHHEIKIKGERANFSFTIENLLYASNFLNISSYYYSISFIEVKRIEKRIATVILPKDENIYTGRLIMNDLVKGNYLLCVVFMKNNNVSVMGSSRFCDVVSISKSCELKYEGEKHDYWNVSIIAIFIVLLLSIVIIFVCIRDFVYRPRTIEAILENLSPERAKQLTDLATEVGERRRRGTKPGLTENFRQGSIISIEDQDYDYEKYHRYHAYDNPSFPTVHEEDETS